MMGTIKLAVLASGRGSNFKAIADSMAAGGCDARIVLLLTDKPSAPAISIAKERGIPVQVLEKSGFPSREAFDDRVKELIDGSGAELVALAGYMLILRGKKLFEAYKGRIINIHPSLLPSFPGVDAQKQAFDYGCKVAGLTIHFVDESLDGGPIIYQESVDISDCQSADEAAARILEREHQAYPRIIDSFSKGKYEIEGRRVRYFPQR